jgi:hypothetical protein
MDQLLACERGQPSPLFLHRIFEGNAFRIVLLDPSVGRFAGGKDLEMIDVAWQRVGVDVQTVFIGRSLRFWKIPDNVGLEIEASFPTWSGLPPSSCLGVPQLDSK